MKNRLSKYFCACIFVHVIGESCTNTDFLIFFFCNTEIIEQKHY